MYKIRIVEQSLARITDRLMILQARRKQSSEEVVSKTKLLQKFENSNVEYTEQLTDRREVMLAYWRILLIVLAGLIDFIISINAMTLITERFSLNTNWKYVVPFLLVLIETGIAYTCSIKQREGKSQQWVTQKLPYAVLILLIGFTVLVILFELNAYNPETDGLNFFVFAITTIAVQLTLLSASVLMHIWIIQHSDDIAESISFLKFRFDHSSMRRAIDEQQKNNPQLEARFVSETQAFVRDFQSFKRYYPDDAHELLQTIPVALKIDMEHVMGYPFTTKRRTPQNPEQ